MKISCTEFRDSRTKDLVAVLKGSLKLLTNELQTAGRLASNYCLLDNICKVLQCRRQRKSETRFSRCHYVTQTACGLHIRRIFFLLRKERQKFDEARHSKMYGESYRLSEEQRRKQAGCTRTTSSVAKLVTLQYIIVPTQKFVLPTYCTILYLLYSLLRVSALNLGHLQGAVSLFDVYSVYGKLYIRKWQTVYINELVKKTTNNTHI